MSPASATGGPTKGALSQPATMDLHFAAGVVDIESVSEIREDRKAIQAWSRSMGFAVVAILFALGGLVYAAILMAQAIAESSS
jgi:hypothetical protein